MGSGFALGSSYSQNGLFGPNGANVQQAQGSFGTTSINLGASVSYALLEIIQPVMEEIVQP